MNKRIFFTLLVVTCFYANIVAQFSYPDLYNVIWNKQSVNSSESMPCGGGGVGLNVWVENNELLFYIQQSGAFDEHNTFLKAGRVRVKLSPNPFVDGAFEQKLNLKEGNISVYGKNKELSTRIIVSVDLSSNIHVELISDEKFEMEVLYENWRFEDRELRKNESFGNSYKWAPPKGLKSYKDQISFTENTILFYHRNKCDSTVFDATVKQQGLDSVKHKMTNPLQNLTSGGVICGDNLVSGDESVGSYFNTNYKSWSLKSKKPESTQNFDIYLHISQDESIEEWEKALIHKKIVRPKDREFAKTQTQNWWAEFWKRSFILIDIQNKDNEAYQIGENYQLFRYMLGCNAFGTYPTKFNGGLFAYDPCFVDSNKCFSPDFRNWGGGTFTAQNQRLVYFPMLKSGDFDLMKPQLDFYLSILKNAELRSEFYWKHDGACITEQIENFGLPNCSEYGWKRPDWYDKGMQYNAWLEYQWDTSLEICLMMLEQYYYSGRDISDYIGFIESCLTFFNEHYQYLAHQRGRKIFDENNDLVFYPGSACETYKMAYNASSTITGLKVVIEKLINLPEAYTKQIDREKWQQMLNQIPPLAFRTIEGKSIIAPAKLWERVNNTEAPQLYPVFPYGIYGVDKPGLDTALNTYLYDPDLQKFRGYVGWKQDNIFAACLGLTDEAWRLTSLKLRDSERRFPTFWGPGFDWTPDHNQGGSGMVGLQEMLLQTNGEKILLFPAWPKKLDVHFRLYAPDNTIVEAKMENGIPEIIYVSPSERRQDILILPIR